MEPCVEYLYVLIDTNTGKRMTNTKGTQYGGLYKTKSGPAQLKYWLKGDNYKIVKYKVTLEEVE